MQGLKMASIHRYWYSTRVQASRRLEWDTKNFRLLLKAEFVEFVAALVIPGTAVLAFALLYPPDVANPASQIRLSRFKCPCKIAGRTLYPRRHLA